MDISCAFATSLDTPDHIVHAESLGYRRAWCYDSPALYPDVWAMLALAATRTSRIGLGPGVLVPSLRHPMANAAAIATLAGLAPGRTAVAVGAGFTGRYTLGQRPLRWSYVRRYVEALQALLRGDEVEWEGGVLRMLHPDGFVASRPVEVPILVGADGPIGREVAKEVADGVFSAGRPPEADEGLPSWRAVLAFGTVLDEGEDTHSERAVAAAGHALAAVYHALYERGGADAVDALPGGQAWREATEATDARTRHLAVHAGHLVAPNERDRRALAAGGATLLESFTFTGAPDAVRARLDDLESRGATEIAYQPAGPDIPGELERFARMAGIA